MTPLEAVTGEKPDISKLIPFYAPGVFHLTKEEREGKAWLYKAEACRFLGYSEHGTDSLIIVSLRNRAILERANCKFDIAVTAEDLASVRPEHERAEEQLRELYDDAWDELPEDQRAPILEDEDEPISAAVVIPGRKGDKPDSDSDSEDETDRESWSEESVALLSDCLVNRCALSQEVQWCADEAYTGRALVLPPNPTSIDEALRGPDAELWRAAIKKELEAFTLRGTWGPAEQRGRGMKTKMILKHQFDNDYKLKHKARLVVCGYSQIKGLEYNDTYSPTTTAAVVMYVIHLSKLRDYEIRVFDISAAYLEGKADCEMFAWLPAEISAERVRTRVKILGNWYGEKQAGRIWHHVFDDILVAKMGFHQCPMTPCLYVWRHHGHFIILSIHVDDGIMGASDPKLFDEFMQMLQQHVHKAVMYEDPKKFLGMELEYLVDNKVKIHQRSYVEQHYGDFTKKMAIPMSGAENLRRCTPNPNNHSLLEDTGRFRFLADRTRPDILFATGELSTGGDKNPSDQHLAVCEKMKHYLNSTKDLGIVLGGKGKPYLFGYCDASYITEGDAKCRLAGVLFYGEDSGAIDSFCKTSSHRPVLKQQQAARDQQEAADEMDIAIAFDALEESSLSHSSTEAEIKAIDEMVRLVEYWIEILEFTGEPQQLPVKIFVDNKSAQELCRVLKTTHAVRHINMRIRYIHDMISRGIIGLYFVPSELNVADLGTKPLPRVPHHRHTDIVLNGHGNRLDEILGKYALHVLQLTD